MFRSLVAKFPGTCVRCRKAGLGKSDAAKIRVGQTIRYGGKGQTYHLSKECPASQTEAAPQHAFASSSCNDDGQYSEEVRTPRSDGEVWADRHEEGYGPGGY